MPSGLFDNAKVQYEKKLPFVLYRKPHEITLNGVFQKNNALFNVKDFSESGFIMAPFNNKEAPLLLVPDTFNQEIFQIQKGLDAVVDSFPKSDRNEKDAYTKLVREAIAAIKDGKLKKVVLSRKIEIKKKANLFSVFCTILKHYTAAFCYLWYHPKVGLWMGASPELLLEQVNGNIKTVSLAGTLPANMVDTFTWGAKEQSEQKFVTDYILGILNKRAIKVQIGDPITIKAGNLLHLKTELNARLKDISIKGLIRDLHPTPAICGLPAASALAFIEQKENYKRQYYGGFLGELNLTKPAQAHLFVNLRCLQLTNASTFIYVGGGVVADSIADREWEETVAKSATMYSILLKSGQYLV